MSSPLASLERSHVRHSEIMSELVAAARNFAAGRATPSDLSAVQGAVDYLRRSVPRHFLDEEESLFPRLARRRPEAAAPLARLAAEHADHRALHARIAVAAERLSSQVRPAVTKQLLEAVAELAARYEEHAAQEDVWFATAAEELSPGELHEIELEMEARRGRRGLETGGGGGGRGGGGGGGGGGGRRRAEPGDVTPMVISVATPQAPGAAERAGAVLAPAANAEEKGALESAEPKTEHQPKPAAKGKPMAKATAPKAAAPKAAANGKGKPMAKAAPKAAAKGKGKPMAKAAPKAAPKGKGKPKAKAAPKAAPKGKGKPKAKAAPKAAAPKAAAKGKGKGKPMAKATAPKGKAKAAPKGKAPKTKASPTKGSKRSAATSKAQRRRS